MSKYWVFSGSYFPVFGLNTGKHEAGKAPYLDTFDAVVIVNVSPPVELVITQFADQVRMGLISHLISGISRVLQKLYKYFLWHLLYYHVWWFSCYLYGGS